MLLGLGFSNSIRVLVIIGALINFRLLMSICDEEGGFKEFSFSFFG